MRNTYSWLTQLDDKLDLVEESSYGMEDAESKAYGDPNKPDSEDWKERRNKAIKDYMSDHEDAETPSNYFFFQKQDGSMEGTQLPYEAVLDYLHKHPEYVTFTYISPDKALKAAQSLNTPLMKGGGLDPEIVSRLYKMAGAPKFRDVADAPRLFKRATAYNM